MADPDEIDASAQHPLIDPDDDSLEPPFPASEIYPAPDYRHPQSIGDAVAARQVAHTTDDTIVVCWVCATYFEGTDYEYCPHCGRDLTEVTRDER